MKMIAQMIMERDALNWDETMDIVLDVQPMILQAVMAGDYDEAENILHEELGLEPDYIWEFI